MSKNENFSEKVFEVVRLIPKGKITTYKEIANALGVSAYRAVGNVLKNNKHGYCDGGNTPCHRVVNSNGGIGGFFGEIVGDKIELKKKILEKEKIFFDSENFVIDFEDKFFRF